LKTHATVPRHRFYESVAQEILCPSGSGNIAGETSWSLTRKSPTERSKSECYFWRNRSWSKGCARTQLVFSEYAGDGEESSRTRSLTLPTSRAGWQGSRNTTKKGRGKRPLDSSFVGRRAFRGEFERLEGKFGLSKTFFPHTAAQWDR